MSKFGKERPITEKDKEMLHKLIDDSSIFVECVLCTEPIEQPTQNGWKTFAPSGIETISIILKK